MTIQPLILGGSRNQQVSIQEFISAIDTQQKIEVSGTVIEEATASRKVLEQLVENGESVYGVTTGFGAQGDIQIPPEQQLALQEAVIEYHGAGIGPLLSERQSRAVFLARIISLARGVSGIRPELLEHMVRVYNAGIAPVIPSRGSVGASGDLTPLSYAAALLAGKREAWFKGQRISSAQALQQTGIEPWSWDIKEGLALINGTAVMTALSALSVDEAERLAEWSDRITAAAAESLRIPEEAFGEWVHKSKHHPGQIDSARAIRSAADLDTKPISQSHSSGNIQARYSLRCAAQINGVLRDTVTAVQAWIEQELNSANDNPLFEAGAQRAWHTGNFYGGHISAACDFLRTAVATTVNLLDRQMQLLLEGSAILPANLVPQPSKADTNTHGSPQFGLKALGISTSALAAEVQQLAGPISVLSRPTESGNQDVVSMGTLSALKLVESLDMSYLCAAHVLAATAQALEIAECSSSKAHDFIDFVRRDIPFIKKNTALGHEIEKLAGRIRFHPAFTDS